MAESSEEASGSGSPVDRPSPVHAPRNELHEMDELERWWSEDEHLAREEAASRHVPGSAPSGVRQRSALFAAMDLAPPTARSIVIVVGIDDFGHLVHADPHIREQLVAQFESRVVTGVRRGDVVVRMAGGRLGVYGLVIDGAEARSFAERLKRVVSDPFEIDDDLLDLQSSLGAASGVNSDHPRGLMMHAEASLQTAQASGGNRLCFSEPLIETSSWHDLEFFAAEVRTAMDRGTMYLAYQPVVDLASGRLVKVEALLRWTHPVRGALLPGEFIPFAERSGVIDELGAWVLRSACGW